MISTVNELTACEKLADTSSFKQSVESVSIRLAQMSTSKTVKTYKFRDTALYPPIGGCKQKENNIPTEINKEFSLIAAIKSCHCVL